MGHCQPARGPRERVFQQIGGKYADRDRYYIYSPLSECTVDFAKVGMERRNHMGDYHDWILDYYTPRAGMIKLHLRVLF